MAQVVGGDRQGVAAELFTHPSPHLLQGGAAQIGLDLRQCLLTAPQAGEAEAVHPLRLEWPHLVFTCFGGGQHPDHPVTVLGQGTEIAEKHLVVAQSIGGHQAVGQPPSGVGDPQHRFEDLCVCRQLPEACPVQPIAAGFLSPVLRQGKAEMLGQGREGRGTLLATAASILVTAQGLQ